MKKSRLLTTSFTINDILDSFQPHKKPQPIIKPIKLASQPEYPTQSKKLHQSLNNFNKRKFISEETNDSEQFPKSVTGKGDVKAGSVENSVESEKLRIKREKAEKLEKDIRKLDVSTCVWEQKQNDKTQIRISSLKHLLKIETKNNILKYGINLNSKGKERSLQYQKQK